MIAPLLVDEPERLAELRGLQILDTPPEEDFDDLTQLAAYICEMPIALISLVDQDRQWFKSRVGLDVCETSRSSSFCAHALGSDETFIVPDAQRDGRFAGNPLVVGDPHIRFYAGVPIRGPEGHCLGTLCVIGREPGGLTETQEAALRVLARQVVALFKIRRQNELLRDSEDRLRGANQRLEQMVRTDALTGLGNRRMFNERMRQEWKLAERLGHPLSLLMVDVDHFKRINDEFGHAVGDRVLHHLGELLDSATRETDTCARYGGEEFAILLPATSLKEAAELAERLRRRVEETPCEGKRITVSVGVACSGGGGMEVGATTLLVEADDALYRAKAAGRNRVERAGG